MATSIVSTGYQFPDSTVQTTAVSYSWLTSNLFNTVGNCGGSVTSTNCIGTGNIVTGITHQLIDVGGKVGITSLNNLANCDCNCDCTCA